MLAACRDGDDALKALDPLVAIPPPLTPAQACSMADAEKKLLRLQDAIDSLKECNRPESTKQTETQALAGVRDTSAAVQFSFPTEPWRVELDNGAERFPVYQWESNPANRNKHRPLALWVRRGKWTVWTWASDHAGELPARTDFDAVVGQTTVLDFVATDLDVTPDIEVKIALRRDGTPPFPVRLGRALLRSGDYRLEAHGDSRAASRTFTVNTPGPTHVLIALVDATPAATIPPGTTPPQPSPRPSGSGKHPDAGSPSEFRWLSIDTGYEVSPPVGAKAGGAGDLGVSAAGTVAGPLSLGGHAYYRYVADAALHDEHGGAVAGVEGNVRVGRRVSIGVFADGAMWFVGNGYLGFRVGASSRQVVYGPLGFWEAVAFETYSTGSMTAPSLMAIDLGLSCYLGGPR
jgi:hypothetical protein